MMCGARHKYRPGRCRALALKGRRRCRMHGGTNPGRVPHAPVVMGPAWKARDQRQALYKSLGMAWPGGPHRTHAVTLSVIAKAKQTVARNKRDLSTALPDIIKLARDRRPLAELNVTPAEALARVAWKGLEQLDRILSITLPKDDPIEIRENIKTLRLVGDMAVAANRLLAQIGEGGARVQRDTQLAMLLAEIRRDKELGRLK
jgi:hypothetical protein